MPSKRTRKSTCDGEDSDTTPTSTPTMKRRKKSTTYDANEVGQELYDTIRGFKTDEGKLLCEPFIRLPNRRSAVDYYEVVTQPIDLLKIQNRVKNEEYDDITGLSTDIELLVNNAKSYFKKFSPEYKAACELLDLYNETKQRLMADLPEETETPKRQKLKQDVEEVSKESEKDDRSERSSIAADDPDNPFEQLFTAVMNAKEGDRNISEMFRLLPKRVQLPYYYEVIKDPIDLKMIAIKIQGNEYSCLDEMEKDLALMVRNAKTFNEPGSMIYKDAVGLKKVIVAKKQELDHPSPSSIRPVKVSERIRQRRNINQQRLSAVCAALQYPSDDESDLHSCHDNVSHMDFEDDSGAESSVVDGEDSSLWLLFNTVKNYKNSLNEVLSEPFMRLPNKRSYPGYYKDIKHPLSLLNVQKKLKDDLYNSIEDLEDDLNVVFDNAQKYNRDDSRLFKDAKCLQKVMKTKKKEMTSIEQKVQSTIFAIQQQDEEEEAAEEIVPPAPQPVLTFKTPAKVKRTPAFGSEGSKRSGRKILPPAEALLRRLWSLFNALKDHQEDGRYLIDIFMQLPSKKDYPDYYNVIADPIDMTIIENKIRSCMYKSDLEQKEDFLLMFNNARIYNEEGSQVYKDAEKLEKLLKKKWRNLTPLSVLSGTTPRTPPKKSILSCSKLKPKAGPALSEKLEKLFATVRDYRDSHDRELSTPFMVLPSKVDYPDYYLLIKRPIDMQKIQQRLMSNQYESLEDMVSDLVLMFDNACKYNEPDSLIYKDALTLQRVCLEKKAALTAGEEGSGVPDVAAIVHEMMTNLFISVYNYQDDDCRCYSDSFAELKQERVDESDPSVPLRKPNFDQVKKNIDKFRYRRIDKFQEDMFEVFEYARRVSRADSQVYEDAVEMQLFFIKIRDELCKNGELLLTPALSYTARHLMITIENEKKEKLAKEQREDEEKKKHEMEEKKETEKLAVSDGDGTEFLTVGEHTYNVGDFVYIEPRENAAEPHIVCIEKLWTDPKGQPNLYGNFFLRPNETYHIPTRKFLEKEVFKSDFSDNAPLHNVLGKCFVMSVKEYFKMKPEGFQDKDVWVCESRYSSRHKAFKKIKCWQLPKNEDVRIVPREQPLPAVRVASIFAKGDDVDEWDDGQMLVLDRFRENVPLESTLPDDGAIYFEQFLIPAGCMKLGDFVYVRSDQALPFIARIDKMWTDSKGDPYFHGPWFVRPTEVEHPPTRLFYHNEVFRSTIEDTNPMLSIMGKCAVLYYKDYCTSRMTEVPENDVYVCESKYLEAEKAIRKMAKPMKKFSNSTKVIDDEIYYFRRSIVPTKEPSPFLLKASEEGKSFDVTGDESSTENRIFAPFPEAEPVPEKKKKNKTLLEEIMKPPKTNTVPKRKWKSLPDEEKRRFEEKAKRIADEQNAKQAEAERAFNESLNMYPPSSPSEQRSASPGAARANTPAGAHQVGYQGVTPQGQYGQAMHNGTVHGMAPHGYTPQGLPTSCGLMPMGMSPGAQPCNSPMYPQGMPQPYSQMVGSPPPSSMQGPPPGMTPSPGLRIANPSVMMGKPSLLYSSSGGMIHALPVGGMVPSVNFQAPRLLGSTVGQFTAGVEGQTAVAMGPPPPPPRPPSPMFVSVPPRTQRLLHSEAYLRYIEGLQPESRYITDWEKNLNATPENTPLNAQGKLPVDWLAQGAGHHGNVVDALWALRDHMLKDTLTVSRTLEFSQL